MLSSIAFLQLTLLLAPVLSQNTETRDAPAPTQSITTQGGSLPTTPPATPGPYTILSTILTIPSSSAASGSGSASGSSPPCFASCQTDASQNIPPSCGSLTAPQCACDPAVVRALYKCLLASCETAQVPVAERLLLDMCPTAAQIVSSAARSASVAGGGTSQQVTTSASASASPTDSVADSEQLNPTSAPDNAKGNTARGLRADAPAAVAVLLAGLSMEALAGAVVL